jgi:dihydrofolate reductase
MRLSIIVAMSNEGLIGNETGLPWHLPSDLKRFRNITWGKPVIMGRKTFGLLGKPLDGRPNIVLTHQPDFPVLGAEVAHSLDEALTLASKHLSYYCKEVFIIGGATVFREAVPLCDRIYLTVVEGQFTGNTYFLEGLLSPADWRMVQT